MKYTHKITGTAVTIVLSAEVMDLLTAVQSRQLAIKAEPYLRRLADRGKYGMASDSRFRNEGKGIWALKPQPIRIYGWFDGPGEHFFVAAVAIKKEKRRMDTGDFEKTCKLRETFRRDTDALNLSELEE